VNAIDAIRYARERRCIVFLTPDGNLMAEGPESVVHAVAAHIGDSGAWSALQAWLQEHELVTASDAVIAAMRVLQPSQPQRKPNAIGGASIAIAGSPTPKRPRRAPQTPSNP